MTVGMEYWSDPDNRDDGYITWCVLLAIETSGTLY